MEERKKNGKRKYVGDYETSSDGEFVYTGKYFCFDIPTRMKIIYSVLALAMAAVFLFGGLINNQGSRVIYVILPYVAMFLPIAFMLSDVYRIVTVKGNMTRKQYDHSVVQLKHVSVALIILSFITVAGDIAFLLTGCLAGYINREFLFLLAGVTIFILNIIFVGMQNKVSGSVSKN